MKKFLSKVSVSAASAIGAVAVLPGQVMAQKTMNPLGDNGDVTKPMGFAKDLGSVINSVLSFALVIAALLVLFYLVWGGIEWITSGGDKGKTESARNKITSAIIGLIILAAAYAIFSLVHQNYAISHFTKADTHFIGIYDFLMRESAKILIAKGSLFMNYEQDLGFPGLRESKKSFMSKYLKKFTIGFTQ